MANPTLAPVMLQLCPNDLAPFAQICDLYAQAAGSLGASCITIYLEQRAAQPVDAAQHAGQVHYLLGPQDSAASVRQLRTKLESTLHSTVGATQPTLALCHRHRSYRVLRNSRFLAATNIVLAHEYRLLARWQRRLDRWLFGRAFRFAGIAPAVAAEIAKVTGEPLAETLGQTSGETPGGTPSGTLVLPNGLDQQALTQRLLPPAQARALLGAKRWPVQQPSQVIGVVGRLHRKKRPQLALDTYAQFLDSQHNGTQAQLLFIGDGELRDTLEQQAAQANLKVHFCGFVEDAPSALAGLDVLLLTSSAAEAFGMVALEAMAAGVPVVAPDLPGPKSVLGDLGFYFSSGTTTDAGANTEQQPLANNAAVALAQALSLAASDELGGWQQRAQQRVQDHFSIAATARRLKPWLVRPP